jgi:hypothetical protein
LKSLPSAELALPIEGTSASLDADQTGVEFCDQLHEKFTSNATHKNAASFAIDTMQLEDVLSHIDSEDVDLHVYLPPDSSSQSQRRAGGAVHPIKWKAKFGGLDVSDARRLKELERENERLKKY